MMIRASTEIAATSEEVFAFITDDSRLKTWQPDVVESYPPAGGLRVGARARAVVEEYGRRFEVELIVVEFEPNQRLVYQMEAPTASVRVEYQLTRAGHRTRLEQLATMRPKGIMWLLGPFIVGMVRRKMVSRLGLLRDVIEGNTEPGVS
jgi:uncharacterized protein YndB with AHSA1/START domain